MNDELKQTIKILREPGDSDDSASPTEFELVTTVMLKRMLSSDDEERKRRIRKASEQKEGLLAHHVDDDSFAIIDDTDLRAIIDDVNSDAGETSAADVTYEVLSKQADGNDEEFSLVSTQALCRILNKDKKSEKAEPEESPDDGGFDPYNSG